MTNQTSNAVAVRRRLRVPLIAALALAGVALAAFIVCSLAVCAVYSAGLGVYKQGSRLAEDVPKYAERIGDFSDGRCGSSKKLSGTPARTPPVYRHKSPP